MIRVTRDRFPLFTLPPGYSFTWYHSGCEAWWEDIQVRSDQLTALTRETFSNYFGEAPDELPRRQCFLVAPDGRPIGTATAWFDNSYHGQVWGRLHWVAIVPEFQERGLAKPLMSAVCQRMRESHPERSYLRTAPQRLAAIGLYLKFGFTPEIRTAAEAPVWKQVLEEVQSSRFKVQS